jgi:hypothetical protein
MRRFDSGPRLQTFHRRSVRLFWYRGEWFGEVTREGSKKHRKSEGGVLAGATFYGNRAAHPFAEAFGDDQAESGASTGVGRRGVDLTEGRKKTGDLVRRQADSGVGHGKKDPELATVATVAGAR